MQDLYLIHHGVEGQHWGKRNGPPYPLDSAISTGKKLIEKHNQRKVNRAASRIKRRVDKEGYVNRKTREFSFKRDRINATTGLDVKITDGVMGALGSGYFALLGSPSAAITNAIVTAGIIGITEATRRLGNKYYDKKINRYNTAYDLVKNKKISEVKTENKNSRKVADAKTMEDLNAKSSLVLDKPIKVPSSKSNDAVRKKIERAKTTGKFDMDFVERNLDQDKNGKALEGKALYDAYEKYLRNLDKK